MRVVAADSDDRKVARSGGWRRVEKAVERWEDPSLRQWRIELKQGLRYYFNVLELKIGLCE